jgi:hypothetical protein
MTLHSLHAKTKHQQNTAKTRLNKYKKPFLATAIIGLPTQPLNDIVDATGATFNSDFGIYQVDCNVQFQWIITLNKNRFVVDQTKAVLSVGDGVTCFLGFEDLEYPGFDILLGSPFMRDFCAVYDITGKLGFAQVKAN